MFFPHNSFSSSFCVERVIHVLWFESIGCRPLIWAPFKLQIKGSLFKLSYLKTGIYPREIAFYSLTHFIRKLGHRLPSYRTTFIWQKCCFVITARLASINKLAWNYQIIHQEPLPFRELYLVSKAYLALYSNFPALFDYSFL